MTASPDSKTVYLVAGDIGGTNSRLGLYSSQTKDDHGLPSQLVYKEYKNEEHLTAAPDGDSNVDKETAFERRILAPFLKHCWETKSDEATSEKLQSIHESELVVCLAVCGPVRDNQVMLNKQKELQINGDDILQRNSRKRKQAAGNDDTSTFNPYLAAIVDCQIINDFVAQGYGCLSLDHDKDVTELTPASKDLKRKNPSGTMVCLGAGTGLGCCFLTCSNGTYTCHPSEFGQTEWAVTFDSEELQLFNETEGVTLETVVSGKGFSFCYDIYADSIFNDGQVNQDVRNEYLKKKSLTDEMKVKLVVENVDNHCRACHKAMETVMR
jgi:glucokinase